MLNTLGIDGPTQVVRTHVRIAPETQTAAEAMLFQTDGYEYVGTGWSPDAAYEKPNGRSPLANRAPLSLLVDTDAELRGGVDTLGGEARLVSWHQIAGALPRCPGELVKAVQAAQACRLVLASPAMFAGGYLPDFTWLRAQFPNLKIEVAAALVTRYDVISGWDFAIQKPKATRRLVPAGSVYYLTLKDSTPADIDAFVRAVWFQNISDDEQTRRDGFGLAIVGTWDGKPRPMEVRPTHQEDRHA